MEQIITLKVDLEHPDDAKFAIDEAVKAYEADRLKWTEEEIAEAKHLAMKIMEQLCLDGYSIEWCGVTEAYYYKAVSVWLKSPDDESFKRNATCCMAIISSRRLSRICSACSASRLYSRYSLHFCSKSVIFQTSLISCLKTRSLPMRRRSCRRCTRGRPTG